MNKEKFCKKYGFTEAEHNCIFSIFRDPTKLDSCTYDFIDDHNNHKDIIRALTKIMFDIDKYKEFNKDLETTKISAIIDKLCEARRVRTPNIESKVVDFNKHFEDFKEDDFYDAKAENLDLAIMKNTLDLIFGSGDKAVKQIPDSLFNSRIDTIERFTIGSQSAENVNNKLAGIESFKHVFFIYKLVHACCSKLISCQYIAEVPIMIKDFKFTISVTNNSFKSSDTGCTIILQTRKYTEADSIREYLIERGDLR